MTLDFDKIAPLCSEFGVELTPEKRQSLTRYAELLCEWNEKMNLTALTSPEDILYKHFYDCLLFFKAVDVPEGAKVIDVGTGAGFPGMVLKIMRPDIKLTLLDSLNKRLTFLNAVLDALEKSDVKIVKAEFSDGVVDITLKVDRLPVGELAQMDYVRKIFMILGANAAGNNFSIANVEYVSDPVRTENGAIRFRVRPNVSVPLNRFFFRGSVKL